MNIQWSVSLEKHIYRQLHILRLKQTAEYAMEDGPGEGILWPISYLTTVKYMNKKTWDFDCCEKALQIGEQVFNEVAYVCLNVLHNFEDRVVTNQNLIDAWDQKDIDARIQKSAGFFYILARIIR